MEQFIRSWSFRLLVILPLLSLGVGIVIWKRAEPDVGHSHPEKRSLKEAFDEKMMSDSGVQRRPESQSMQPNTGGAMYVHWGRTECTSDESELVYSGVAGGGEHGQKGAAVNLVCLTKHPKWGKFGNEEGDSSVIYGAEYQVNPRDFPFGHANAVKLHDHNVPCAVCRSLTRSSHVMIPGQNVCTKGWHLEYAGYLMAGHHTHPASSEYNCIDPEPEADPAGYRDENGRLLYRVQAQCGSLPCPPYVQGRPITCAVCTK